MTTVHDHSVTNGSTPTVPKIDALKQAVKDAEGKATKSKRAAIRAGEKVEAAAEAFRQARTDEDAATQAHEADLTALRKAEKALRDEQRNVA